MRYDAHCVYDLHSSVGLLWRSVKSWKAETKREIRIAPRRLDGQEEGTVGGIYWKYGYSSVDDDDMIWWLNFWSVVTEIQRDSEE